MLAGTYLTLFIGPGSPGRASADVMEALESVEVTQSTQASGFQLTFKVGKTSPLQTNLLPAGYFDPIVTRVIIVVTVNGASAVLMDGVIVHHEFMASNEIGKSTLVVTGEDISLLMDLVELPFMRFPAMPVIARVYAILAKYAVLGVVPMAVSPIIPDVSNPLEDIPTQTGTDLAYIKEMAAEAGYIFCIEPGPAAGSSIAYFGPDLRIPHPQPALNVDMEGQTNVESLSFSLDGAAKKIVVVTALDPVTKKIPIPLPVPNINVLRPPLAARPTVPSKIEFAEGMATLGVPEALNRALGLMSTAKDSVTASGSLDVVRYGHVLRARMLVGVRGAGVAYDGLYYVNSVTHSLKAGAYKQQFSLSRDGLNSNTARVPA